MNNHQIKASEKLSRFLFSKKDFSSENNCVKHRAFMPPQNKKLSVFRIYDLSESAIWLIGVQVEKNRPSSLKARADITASSIYSCCLKLDPDNIPKRHTNIIGWPSNESEILLKAIHLSERPVLHIKP